MNKTTAQAFLDVIVTGDISGEYMRTEEGRCELADRLYDRGMVDGRGYLETCWGKPVSRWVPAWKWRSRRWLVRLSRTNRWRSVALWALGWWR